jgi:two-component system, sensor histidine kinase and response regulator
MPETPEAESAPILVVDDNEANRTLAQSTLEDEGYRVVLAAGGAEAVVAFERESPACVLLDVRMPEVDGFAACERIRALPKGAETPVIFLTALRDLDTFDRALRAGGDDFLTKPVRPTELLVRVQTALKLRRLGAELAEHYELLKRQRDDLTRLQLQKERLMAFLVHDLKNPVSSMDLHAQLLLRDRSASDDVRAAAAQIRTEARHLTRMILTLLDLSKADEGKLVPCYAAVDLPGLVAEVFAELEAHARGRKVVLRSSLEKERVSADPDLLRRVLTNLVENAIRHAPPETAVTVTTVAGPVWTELRVADAGTGVPREMREKIFDPFVQVEQTSSGSATRAGRGLGLTFCRAVADAHGGAIWVEDAAPGSIFCMKLPEREHA